MPIKTTFRTALLVSTGTLLSLLFIAISIRHMDWGLVSKELSAIPLYPWFYVGVVIYLAGHLIRGQRTQMLLSRDARLSLITSTNIVIAGYAVNNIIPARFGELARAAMMSERTGISPPQSLTVVFTERIMDGISIVLLCIMAIFMTGSDFHSTRGLLPLIFCAGLAFIFLIIWAPQRFIDVASKTAYTMAPRHHDAVVRLATAIVNGAAYLSSPKNFLKITTISLLIWLCDAGLFVCIAYLFKLTAGFWDILLIMTIANLGVFLITSPGYASPGNISSFHVLIMQGLVMTGHSQAAALAYAITLHCAIYIPIMIWGGSVMLWYGITLGLKLSLTRKAKLHTDMPKQLAMARPIGTTFAGTINEKATPFMYALAEASLPLYQYRLDNQETVTAYCADFVQGEIRSLSKKFQLLFTIGMLGFNLLIWARYFQIFTRLPLSHRIQIFNGWAYGKIPLTRQLFKLIRSTALLAFFEHPAVVRCLEDKKTITGTNGQ